MKVAILSSSRFEVESHLNTLSAQGGSGLYLIYRSKLELSVQVTSAT